MKKILPLVFTAFIISACTGKYFVSDSKTKIFAQDLKSSEYVKGSEDIPLAANLEQIESNNINFDSASGSIAFIDYKSSVSFELIAEFYLKTLPQMGWKLVKNDPNHLKFVREDENVEIDFIVKSSAEENDVVRFFLSSATR